MIREHFNSGVKYQEHVLKWDTVIREKTNELARYVLTVDGNVGPCEVIFWQLAGMLVIAVPFLIYFVINNVISNVPRLNLVPHTSRVFVPESRMNIAVCTDIASARAVYSMS